MPRLLLVRHGESEWNALGRWQGQADPPLTDLGERQARLAVDALGTVDLVVSSTLQRASHTAVIVSEGLGVGPVVLEPDLRERDAGPWQGLTRREIEAGWPGYLTQRRRPPGYETDEPLVARSRAALDRLCDRTDAELVLVVTHGGVINSLEAHFGLSWERVPNLGGRWFEWTSGRLTLGDRIELIDHAALTYQDRDQV